MSWTSGRGGGTAAVFRHVQIQTAPVLMQLFLSLVAQTQWCARSFTDLLNVTNPSLVTDFLADIKPPFDKGLIAVILTFLCAVQIKH